ncbi:MAG TPA: hypothetical protein VGK74_29120 [Symbiobacteriaceae bacterium]|jgi:hypothetical protein
MNFWVVLIIYVVACAAVYAGLSFNGADGQTAGGGAHGHDDHGGGHH